MPLLTLGLGSNIAPEQNINACLQSLHALFPGLRCSTIYRSVAQGFDGDPFLNLVTAVETSMPLTQVVTELRALEDSAGRDRSQPKFSSRTLDIDVLTYGASDGGEAGLALPRDEILRYAFVLRPLSELLPDEIHPPTCKTYRQLWQEFEAGSQPLEAVQGVAT